MYCNVELDGSEMMKALDADEINNNKENIESNYSK